jgi:hypothetical protein
MTDRPNYPEYSRSVYKLILDFILFYFHFCPPSSSPSFFRTRPRVIFAKCLFRMIKSKVLDLHVALGSVQKHPFSYPILPLLVSASSQREHQDLEWIIKTLIPPDAAQSCGGTTPPCCYRCGQHKMLKEPLQRDALSGMLDIALGVGLSRVCSKLSTHKI